MTKSEKAVELFEKYNCAQSVFAACAPREGLSEAMCLTIAGPFGAGMGRMGEVCGTVTGALMVLGTRDGQQMATDPNEARGPLYNKVQEFSAEFKRRNGSLLCRELTGCDMCTSEGQADFKARNLHPTLCKGLVQCAVELLGES